MGRHTEAWPCVRLAESKKCTALPEHPEVGQKGMQTRTLYWPLNVSGVTGSLLPLAQGVFMNTQVFKS